MENHKFKNQLTVKIMFKRPNFTTKICKDWNYDCKKVRKIIHNNDSKINLR